MKTTIFSVLAGSIISLSSLSVSADDSNYVNPSNSENYTMPTEGLVDSDNKNVEGHRYATPLAGMQRFANESEMVEYSEKNQEQVVKEENESTGMFMFRAFRNRIENSAKEFQDRTGEFE